MVPPRKVLPHDPDFNYTHQNNLKVVVRPPYQQARSKVQSKSAAFGSAGIINFNAAHQSIASLDLNGRQHSNDSSTFAPYQSTN